MHVLWKPYGREPDGWIYGRPMNSGQAFGLREWFAKLRQKDKLNPAIHLDNRYRLMRHEPMLDAEGNQTDVIGDDENNICLDDLA
ncbi:hypothetical protein KPH14_002594 [Odynerus spinipes]|uniref:Uncharacterized protein n=1 Tax=Odynerus spinipes TaxID=1348599 RepID=A0AAD9R844_9HYME|nr:hypothetical protein KPH14_002594 [Odynerus spinipes]